MYGSNEEEYLVGEVRNHDWTNPMLEELIKWERSFVEPMPEQLNSTHTSILSRQEDMQLACLVPGDSGPTQASIPSPSLAVAVLTALRKSVMRRAVLNKIYQAVSCDNAEERNAPAPVAVLFSGGLDSMILAALLDECLDTKYEIDLLNVSFDGQFAPDRISARAGVKELQRIAPLRSWKLVEIDADLVKLTSETKHVMSLINPAKTYMDLNIGIALWLAAGGNGRVNEVIGNNTDADNQHVKYKSEARILLVGSGADEQCTGYGRHKTKYRQGSWSRLHEEMKLDMQRIWKRNLGRDDRCVADNGKEARFPFLDEDVIRTLLDIPLWEIADLDQPSGVGDKKILREVARLLGLYEAALLPKRAIQGPRQKPSRCSHDHVSITQLDDRKIETAPRSSSSSVKKEIIDDEILRQQAVAAVLLLKQHQQQLQNGSFPQFDRSTSVQYPLTSSKKQNKLPRSSSSRPSSLLDPPAHHLNNQDLKVDDDLETKHFVLVHGGGFGAWCWYKSMTFLKEAGFEADAIDLTGSGIDATDSNSITSFAQYVKPLVDFLENLGDGKKVILVGHDFGGFCVSYVMELFPSKVSKAIFVAAAMLTSGQSTLTAFQGQSSSSDLMRQAQKFIYANGKDNPPTAISLDKSLLSDLLYNLSPTKDAVLASVSMRPMPFAPIMEKLSLSEANYGSIPRFYIKTEEDFAIPVSLQEFMIKSNPPEQVFQLNGSDHSPFFSRPQALHKLLLELSKIPPKQVSSPNSLDGALTEKA